MPLGALWIDGFGPTGPAAEADNVETVRSLSGMAIERNLQLSLSAGLFQMLGIDPKLRDHYTARFGELTILRIKDVGRLEGARGEPRIIEALKASTVTVTTDGEIGLNAQTLGWQLNNRSTSTTNGRTRSRSIEGRDLIVAVRVATPKLIEGRVRDLDLKPGKDNKSEARVDDYRVTYRRQPCLSSDMPAKCSDGGEFGAIKLSSHPSADPQNFVALDAQGRAKLALPVPLADGEGGLFDSLVISRPECHRSGRCENKLEVRYVGTRLQDMQSLRAKGW